MTTSTTTQRSHLTRQDADRLLDLALTARDEARDAQHDTAQAWDELVRRVYSLTV